MAKPGDYLDLALETNELAIAGESPAEEHLHRANSAGGDLLGAEDRALRAAMNLGAKSIARNRPAAGRQVLALSFQTRNRRARIRRTRCGAGEFVQKGVVRHNPVDHRATRWTFGQMLNNPIDDGRARITLRDGEHLKIITTKATTTHAVRVDLRSLAAGHE